MSYWKSTTINLGVIKAGGARKVLFEALPTIPKIANIVPYCGCTDPNYNEKTKILKVTYSNKAIPSQVQAPQLINKKIDIFYSNGEKETLIIKATKVR